MRAYTAQDTFPTIQQSPKKFRVRGTTEQPQNRVAAVLSACIRQAPVRQDSGEPNPLRAAAGAVRQEHRAAAGVKAAIRC